MAQEEGSECAKAWRSREPGSQNRQVCGTRLGTEPGLVLKGLVLHAREFGLGLRAVTRGFGPGDDRAVSSSEKGPSAAWRQSLRGQVGGWETGNRSKAVAQRRRDCGPQEGHGEEALNEAGRQAWWGRGWANSGLHGAGGAVARWARTQACSSNVVPMATAVSLLLPWSLLSFDSTHSLGIFSLRWKDHPCRPAGPLCPGQHVLRGVEACPA